VTTGCQRLSSRHLRPLPMRYGYPANRNSLSFACNAQFRNGKTGFDRFTTVCREIGGALRINQRLTRLLCAVRSARNSRVCCHPDFGGASSKQAGREFVLCMNPSSCAKGCCLDFFNPPFTVIGSLNGEHAGSYGNSIPSLPARFLRRRSSAEMVKYVCNAFHALKISFANEIGHVPTSWCRSRRSH